MVQVLWDFIKPGEPANSKDAMRAAFARLVQLRTANGEKK
jgi:hypothetical protein